VISSQRSRTRYRRELYGPRTRERKRSFGEGSSPQAPDLPRAPNFQDHKISALWKLVRSTGIRPLKKSTLSRNGLSDEKSPWTLPGHGESLEICGKVVGFKCENAEAHPRSVEFLRYVKDSCGRRDCPVCAEIWASMEAERALIRLARYKLGAARLDEILEVCRKATYARPAGDRHKLVDASLNFEVQQGSGKVAHWVLSPPPGFSISMKKDFRTLRRMATSLAREVGIRGGSVIFHAFRLHCSKCDVAIPEYWERCPECGGSDFVWVESPHFHLVGFGWILHRSVLRINKRTGWVIKGLGVRKNVWWTYQYLLSHCGIYHDPVPTYHYAMRDEREILVRNPGFHVVTWIGDLAYNKALNCPDFPAVLELCPYCGALLKRMDDEELNRQPPPSCDFDRVASGCLYDSEPKPEEVS
jgi:hypothetical protein